MISYMISSVIDAQDVAVVLHALVAGEVQRLAEAHAGPGERAELLAGRRDHVGADHRDRDRPGRRSPARAGRRRSCRGRACRRGSGCPRGRCRTARPRRGSAAPTRARPRRRWRPDRSIGTWPAPEKNFFWNQPLMPGVVKYSAFATKVTRRVQRQRHEQPVGVREVVARQDRRTLVGDVLGALDVRAGRPRAARARSRSTSGTSRTTRDLLARPDDPGVHRRSGAEPSRLRLDPSAGAGIGRAGCRASTDAPRSPQPLVRARHARTCTGGRAIGVLLCHGFTGSPASMQPWGEAPRRARGTPSRCRCCPGHGTRWQDLNQVRWTRLVRRGSAAPSTGCAPMRRGRRRRALDGRLLALRLAEERPARRRRRGAGQPVRVQHAQGRAGAAGAQAGGAVVRRASPTTSRSRARTSTATTATAAQGAPHSMMRMWKAVVRRPAEGHPAAALLPVDARTTSSTRRRRTPCSRRSPRATSTSGCSSDSYHVATLDNDAERSSTESADFVGRA